MDIRSMARFWFDGGLFKTVNDVCIFTSLSTSPPHFSFIFSQRLQMIFFRCTEAQDSREQMDQPTIVLSRIGYDQLSLLYILFELIYSLSLLLQTTWFMWRRGVINRSDLVYGNTRDLFSFLCFFRSTIPSDEQSTRGMSISFWRHFWSIFSHFAIYTGRFPTIERTI